MSKRAQRRQTRNEKDQRGCIWGLISIFDLRNGRSPRKLLSDQRPKSHSKGAECSQGKLAPSRSLKSRRSRDGEERTASADTGKTSVRKLMEEEMFNKQGPEEVPSSTKKEANVREYSQSGNKINRVDDIDIYDLERLKNLMSEESCLQGKDLKRLEKTDLGPALQELCQILGKSCSSELHSKTKHDMISDQTPKIDKEKLNEVIKSLQDQSLHGTRLKEDRQFQLSSLLVEALHKFGSQDPDSLMVKQIEGLEETILEKDPSFNSLGDFGSSREKPLHLHPKTDEVINHKVIPRKFSTRRKSHESLPSLGNENYQSSSEIGILKPGQGPAALRPDSVVSPGSSVKCPNRSHSLTERNAAPCIVLKNRETLGKLNQTESLTASSDIVKPVDYNLYVEAKTHILEMIESGANDAQKNSGQLPESLGRILSLSEYEFSSICSSCDQTRLYCSIDSQTDIAEENIYFQPSPSMQCSTSQSYPSHDISDEEGELPKAREGIPSDFVISEGMVGIKEITDRMNERGNETAVNSNESNSFCSLNDAEAEYGVEGLNNYILTQQLQSCVDSEISCSTLTSSAHSYVALKVENLEICTGTTERPSPVSVLDPLLAEDDDISPARISQPVDTKIQPCQIDFNEMIPSNEQEICIRISSDDTETAFDYVEAILLGSGLNWDEYMLRWLSSDTVLDSTLYNEVELFSGKPRHEQRLLFDCTNEVLRELCKNNSHGLLSCTRRNVCAPVPNGMDLILKIWEGVERHLLQYPQPRSLDQLMKKDMETSKATWMDLRLDIELINLEMEKAIIESLVEDLHF